IELDRRESRPPGSRERRGRSSPHATRARLVHPSRGAPLPFCDEPHVGVPLLESVSPTRGAHKGVYHADELLTPRQRRAHTRGPRVTLAQRSAHASPRALQWRTEEQIPCRPRATGY